MELSQSNADVLLQILNTHTTTIRYLNDHVRALIEQNGKQDRQITFLISAVSQLTDVVNSVREHDEYYDPMTAINEALWNAEDPK